MRGKRDDEEQALTGHNGWARDLCYLVIFSQDIYCGGYSGEDPPLPIPNREVKLACADGTATPCGRVGSRPFKQRVHSKMSGLFFCVYVCLLLSIKSELDEDKLAHFVWFQIEKYKECAYILQWRCRAIAEILQRYYNYERTNVVLKYIRNVC